MLSEKDTYMRQRAKERDMGVRYLWRSTPLLLRLGGIVDFDFLGGPLARARGGLWLISAPLWPTATSFLAMFEGCRSACGKKNHRDN
jgi:hypothetical protein